jgi:hypothetical protein
MRHLKVSRNKLLIAILWPSFFLAGVFTGILFAFVDPYTFLDEIGIAADSRLTGYSITFIGIWLGGILVAFFTFYILCTPEAGDRADNQPSG